MNSVKLYSNGSAVVSHHYALDGKELKISIPVKKADLDDVVASISVFGNVTVPTPPSYTPTNAQTTPLTIDVDHVMKSLATRLAGSRIELETGGKTLRGKLVGVQTYQVETNNCVFDRYRIALLNEKGVSQYEEKDVTALKFTDESVQAEIDKALQTSFEQIKPDSSFVDLTLVPNEGASSAAITYATPVAAWKIRYQLRLFKGAWELEGQAIVDNDTDDDWKDTIISVITGDPISFSTDLAEIRRPARNRVNVVAEQATGAVSVEDDLPDFRPTGTRGDLHSPGRSALESMLPSQVAFGSAPESGELAECDAAPSAQQQAEVLEIGDFSIFTAPTPVNVDSKKSAIIPMFTTPLQNADLVLVYKESRESRRPFRAIKIRNEASYSLGKGVCEIYVDGDRQGKCILEACKPGEQAYLVHAKETGVRVFKEEKPVESHRIGIKIKEGAAYCEVLNRAETRYRVKNVKPESFTLEIEHERSWRNSTFEIGVSDGETTAVDIPSGKRITVKLAEKSDLTLTVVETQIKTRCYTISADWLQQNIVITKNPLSRNKGILKCIELQGVVDAIEQQIKEATEQAKAIDEEQTRLKGLIPNAHADQANQWRTELGTNEAELRKLKRTEIPSLKKSQLKARENLLEALADLATSWKEKEETGLAPAVKKPE